MCKNGPAQQGKIDRHACLDRLLNFVNEYHLSGSILNTSYKLIFPYTVDSEGNVKVHYLSLTLFLDYSGYYMFIEASAPRVKDDKARLISPMYNMTARFCVSFYYHMYGKHIGEWTSKRTIGQDGERVH